MSGPTGEEVYEKYLGRVARGAGISFFGIGLGRAAAYITQVTLARLYGPSQLGLYVLGTMVAFFAGSLAGFGLNVAVVRFVAQYRANEDIARVRGTLLLTLGVSFVLSLVLAVVMYLGAGILTRDVFGESPLLETVLKACSISVPFFTLLSTAASATEGFQTMKYSILTRQFLQPLGNLILILLFYLLGSTLLGAVAAYIVSLAAASVLALYYLYRLFPQLLDRNTPPTFESRAVLSLWGAGLVSHFAEYVNVWAATIVLGIFASSEEVGIYTAAARSALLSGIIYISFGYIFAPIVSGYYHTGRLRDLAKLYDDVSRWIFTGGLAVCLLLVYLSMDILIVFGDEFAAGQMVIIIIAVAMLFVSSVGVTNHVLLMTGHQNIYMLAFTTAAVVGIVGSIVLVPHYGMLGAAIACAGSYVIPNVITLIGIRRALNLWPYSRQYAKPVLAGLIAILIVVMASRLFPLPVGLSTLLVLAPLFLAAFALALLGLGLSSSDRQFLNAIWTAIRRTG